MRAQLRPYLNDDLTLRPGMEQRIDRRKMILELDVDDAPAYRSYGADIGVGFVTHLKGGSRNTFSRRSFFSQKACLDERRLNRSLLSEKDLALEIRT